jgi:RimJ/RimL family protein N-acetyltransferase/2-polyprenyl-3-methyl-5-hydroxy-6-metoxy-1,4-benzoquinol methylase
MSVAFTPRPVAPTVEDDGIVLCALEERDAEAILRNDRDPETAARFGWRPDDAELWRCERHVADAARWWRTGERAVFAVRESADGPLVGIVEARGPASGEAIRASWTTLPEHRRRGIGGRAVRALLGWCAREGIREVRAHVEKTNVPSARLARNAGFQVRREDDRWLYLRWTPSSVDIDELALAGPEHLDPAYVSGYDRKAAFDPAQDLAVLRARGVGPDSTLIDLGAGTGTFALAAAPNCKRVVAVDVSPAMVETIRARAAAAGAHNVVAVRAGFLTYAHDGDPAAAIYTRNALHHLPDTWKAVALRRMADLLASGGTLRLRDLVFSFAPADAESGIRRWIDATAVADAAVGWTRAELETHVRNEHSTFTWLLEPMLARAGFEILDSAYAPSGAYADYTCVIERP